MINNNVTIKEIDISDVKRLTDEHTFSMGVWNDKLYFGTHNIYDGGRIYRTGPEGSVETYLTLERNNIDIYGLVEKNGFLYYGTYSKEGGELHRIGNKGPIEVMFRRGFDDPMNMDIWSIAFYDEKLYFGTWNPQNGAKIYCSSEKNTFRLIYSTGNPMHDYIRTLTEWNGYLWVTFGKRCSPPYLIRMDRDQNIENISTPVFPPRSDIYSVTVFNDYMYLGVSAYHRNELTGGCEVWVYDGKIFKLCSKPGFGNCNNNYIHSMTVHKGYLVCATANYETGCEIWASKDGFNWIPLATDGFGEGVRNETIVYSLKSFCGLLWIGTNNPSQGFKLLTISFNS